MLPCAYHACDLKIQENKCLCDKHWEILPFKLQEAIIEGYSIGPESDLFLSALVEACFWIDNPKEPWESNGY